MNLHCEKHNHDYGCTCPPLGGQPKAAAAGSSPFGSYASAPDSSDATAPVSITSTARPEPIPSGTSEAMVQRVERARERYWDFRCIEDLTSTTEEAAEDGGFDEADVAYAVLNADRDDDGDRCSTVTFYDTHGDEMGNGSQSGYLTTTVPVEFLADNAPGEVAGLDVLDMYKVRSWDFDQAARDYAREVRSATDALLADGTR